MDGIQSTDDFTVKSEAFIHWLQQKGTTISPKIELADLRSKDAGRGVQAKEDIDEDEELFSVPRGSILTVETTSLSDNIIQQINDPWLSLIVVMIFEYQQGNDSSWKPYFDVLPSNFNTLMFWSDAELRYLEGSAVVGKIGKDTANDLFQERVLPLLKQHADTFGTGDLTDEELLSLCHRMGSTIMAYAFDMEKPGGASGTEEDGWEEDEEETATQPKAMVPLADILNADADRNNAKLYYEDDKVVMKSLKPIKAGEEIFNDYGPLPQADVLRRYGYTTGNYEKYDVVEIAVNLIRQVTTTEFGMSNDEFEARTAYLTEQDALDDAYDVSRPCNKDCPQFPEELCILLNAVTMAPAEFEKLKVKEKLPKPTLSPESLKLLYSLLVHRRSMYTSVHSEGQSASSAANDSMSAGKRQAYASRVISGEKKVLQEAAASASEMLGDGVGKKRKADTFEEDAQKLRQASKR